MPAKLTVYPRISSAPVTVTISVTSIPSTAQIICFALDGSNYYGGCQELQGRRSVQVQYRDVRAGTYTAYATLDGKLVSTLSVTLVGPGFDD